MLTFAREILSLPARLRYRRLLRGRPLAKSESSGTPALNYGHTLEAGQFVAGGKVKLLHLHERWPESADFNLLYLVSSAAPAFALELVRWAKRRGAKFIWNQNGVGFPAWARWRTLGVNRPLRALLREADHVIYQSEFCRASADRWLGPALCPSTVLFNPVDPAVFCPAPRPPAVQDGWRLLAAGTHYQPFRVLGALETMRVLLDAGHRVQLTVAGALRWPDAEAQVHEAITRLRLAESVSLRPAFSQEEAVRLYQASHALLHLKYHDPCPTVVIEALACGLPVVGSRTGGLQELVGDDGGELLQVPLDWWRASYPPPRRCAAAIARVLRDWPARSAAARQRALRLFQKDVWVAAHGEIFASVLEG